MSNPKPGEIVMVTAEELEARRQQAVARFMPAKTTEQKMLEVLERIERFLYERFGDVVTDPGHVPDWSEVMTKIEPTRTPFMDAITKETKKKRRTK